MYFPRFRKIDKIVEEIKKVDPDTELNWRMIKTLIKEGVITQKKIGNAWLINIDELYAKFWRNEKWNL